MKRFFLCILSDNRPGQGNSCRRGDRRSPWLACTRHETELQTLRQYIITNPASWQQDSLYSEKKKILS